MKIKPISTKLLLMIVSLTLVLTACQKEMQTETTLQNNNPEINWNNTAQAVAKDVSIKLNSLSFRKMLRHEVLLRFDGDANILLSVMMERMSKYLKYEASSNNASRSNANDLLANFSFDIIAKAAKDFPQMQIAVQTNAEKWDHKNWYKSKFWIL